MISLVRVSSRPDIHHSTIDLDINLLIDASIRNNIAYENLPTSVVITGWRRWSWQYASLGRVWRCWCANEDSGFYLSLGCHDSSSVLLLYLQTFAYGYLNPFISNTTELHPEVKPTYYLFL